MPDVLLTTLGTILVAAIGALGAWATKRLPSAGERENKLIDQLQEDADRLRADAVRLSEMIARLEARERLLGDYVQALRRHIADELPPPAPEWPEGLR